MGSRLFLDGWVGAMAGMDAWGSIDQFYLEQVGLFPLISLVGWEPSISLLGVNNNLSLDFLENKWASHHQLCLESMGIPFQ